MKKLQLIEFAKQNYLLVLTTIIGAFLRLYHLRSTLIFLGDQGRDASIVRNLLIHSDLILVGPTTSVGKIQLGPLYYYFMAPWLWLTGYDPIGPALAVALLGIITIPVFYFFTKDLFSKQVAIIATFLYSVSDVIIANTRGSWNPNPMPLATIILLWALYQIYQRKKYAYFILVALSWGVALQLHYMALLLAPVLFIIFALTVWQNKKDVKKMSLYIWLGFLVFIILALPLIIFDFRHNFINYQGFLEFFQKGHHSPHNIWTTIKESEGRLQQILGQVLGFEKLRIVRDNLSWLLAIVFTIYAYFHRKQKSVQLIFIYFITSLIGFTLYSGDVFEHYMGIIFPLPFLLLGILLSFLHKQKLLGKFFVVVTITLIAFWNLKNYRYFKPLGWQIDDVKQVAAQIAADAGGQRFNIALIDSTKDYRGMNYRYFLETDSANLEDVYEYGTIKLLYLITDSSFENAIETNTWEVEQFLNNDSTETASLIKNTWHFEGGPTVYKLLKP
ncbi:hypothetical protein GYA49_05415 [Candidatus Beckwithbacteria bacterium]|nr:hypothetical protein [Candidatus Beckwithbacteria bacterium]